MEACVSATKYCSICERNLSADCFTKNRRLDDGLSFYCRECDNARKRAIREQHPGRTADHNMRWKAKNRGYSTEYGRAYRERQPEAYEAHKRVRTAVRNGTLKRPSCCQSCGREVRLDTHHADYSKPLDVTWLCRRCHRRIHNGLIELRHEEVA